MSSPMRGTVSGRRAANRKEILDELATSEAKYVKKLKATINAYMVPLHDARVLTASELGAVFRGLTDMRDVHSKLNSVIQAAGEDDNVANGIAVVANEFSLAKAALLELYLPYARGHDAAVRTLRSALSRAEVARSVDAISASDERVRGSSLEDLLCAPLDRVAEYRDLLTSLLGMTTAGNGGAPAASGADGGKGYAALSEAADLFGSIVREAIAQGYALPSAAAAAAGASGAAASAAGAAIVAAGIGSLPPGSPAAIAAATAAALGQYGQHHSFTGSQPLGAGGLQGASAATQALVQAAMPLPGPGAAAAAGSRLTAADLTTAEGALSTEAVLAAQAEAEEAGRRLEALEREVALKESELSLTSREVARAEAEKSRRPIPDSAPLEEALRRLGEEERDLLSRISGAEHRALFEAFLARKRELEEEEARLNEALEEHEDTLAKVRARLANPPASVLPSDPAKASLYIAWKRALAEREELLRQARRRKHELLRDLKARHETQVVLLELERRAAVEGLKESVAAERAKVDGYKRDLAALDESIESARAAMARFRQEFEQLRVALLIDRMAKSSQVANLADRRRRLAREAEQFAEAVEAAKQRVAAEEAARWEAKLAAEKEAGEARVAEERRAIEAKIERVRTALAERYEAGFKPLLAEAEARHAEELGKIVALQQELEAKEAELRAAHESARAVSSAVGSLTGAAGGSSGGGNADLEGDGGSAGGVPDWKLREFEDLRNAVATMWEQLDVPAEDITAFLSECDLLAPFSPRVLQMYQDMYRRLTNAAAAAAVAATAPALGSPGAAAGAAAAGGASSQPGSPLGGAGAMPLQPAPGARHTGGYDGEATAALASRAGALAEAYGEASAAAAARARAAAAALSAPLQISNQVVPSTPGGGAAAGSSSTSRGRTPGSANSSVGAGGGHGVAASSTAGGSSAGTSGGAFRSTLFSGIAGSGGQEEAAYLARLAAAKSQLPPSMGGPGARSTHARGGSIHVSAGDGMLRRSPSPTGARALAQALGR